MFQNVKDYIDRFTAEKKIPYIDVLAMRDHQTVYRYFTGRDSGIGGKEKLIMYSCSKPLTAVGAMKLMEEGKLSLSDPVSKYLPRAGEAYLLNEKGEKIKPETEMKICHLLTMSAGLDYNFSAPAVTRLLDRTHDRATTAEIADAILQGPLHFHPGEKFSYSLCMDVMGAVMEVASGMPFAEYMETAVFAPLGMKNSTFDNRSVTPKDCYKTYLAVAGKVLPHLPLHREYTTLPHFASGGAGLKSTVEDYAIFADTLACGGVSREGKRLIGEEALTLMTSQKIDGVSIAETFGCIQGEDYGYGLGVRVRKTPTPYGLPVGEFGWDGAFGSYMMADPVHHISVFIGMNVDCWPNLFVGQHLGIVEQLYRSLSL